MPRAATVKEVVGPEQPDPIPQLETSSAPRGWLDMADAPQDGKPLLLTPDGESFVEGVWRSSRTFDRIGRCWRPDGRWALRNAGGVGVGFVPSGWRPA